MIDNNAWTELRPHVVQSKLWRCSNRLVAVAAGRGSGKTELARRRIVSFLCVKKPWHDPIYFYALPTYKQARRVAWPTIKKLVPEKWLKCKPNESEMTIETVFGSKLFVVGLDKPARVEGNQWDGGVIDEASDQKANWFNSIRPAMSHRNGWIWLIGVPKRAGTGAKDFKRYYHSDRWESFTWPSSTILDAEEIQAAKEDLALKDFREQYEATWETAGGAAFYAFNEAYNVRPCSYDKTKPVFIGSDFNVNPMCWVIGHKQGREVEIFDELFIRNTNTQQTLDILYDRYSDHKSSFHFYGDATGQARRTSASSSDYQQIKNDQRFESIVKYPRKNPAIKNRLSACNAMLKSTDGTVRLHIDPRCTHLIDDLKDRALDDNGLPNDSGDVGHITDALGYLLWPMRPNKVKRTATESVSTHG